MTNYERIMNAMNELSDNEFRELYSNNLQCSENCPYSDTCMGLDFWGEEIICDDESEVDKIREAAASFSVETLANILYENTCYQDYEGEEIEFINFLKGEENLETLKKMKKYYNR